MMKFGITNQGFRRLAGFNIDEWIDIINPEDYPVLESLLKSEGPSIAYRVQPKGAEIEGYSSMTFTDADDSIPNEGVWSFPSVYHLIKDDPEGDETGLEGYYSQVLESGEEPELVALTYTSSEDGPGTYIIAYGAKILQRFDIEPLLQEVRLLHDRMEYLENEEGYDFPLDDFIDYLSRI